MTNETTNTIESTKVVYSKIMERYERHEKNAARHWARLEKDYCWNYSCYSLTLYEEKYNMQLLKDLISAINDNDLNDTDDYSAEFHIDNVFTSCIKSLKYFLKDVQNVRSQSSNNLSNECSTIEYKCKMQMLEYVTALQVLLKSECDEKALEAFFIATL